MRQATAYLVGAGHFCIRGFCPLRGDLVIAADGGYHALAKTGFKPQLLLGDMDSIHQTPRGVARLQFPIKKDETDLALGLRLARARGYRRFKLYGALGGRLDHSVANLHLLAGLARTGLDGMIVDEEVIVRAVSRGSLALPPLPRGQTVSVFCWGEAVSGLSLRGLAYPLTDAQLNAFEPLGVSNEATGQPIRISLRQGVALVFLQSRD